MKSVSKSIIRSALLLSLFAITGTALVAVTYDNTYQRIADNERDYLLRNLHQLVPPALHDNDMYIDAIQIVLPERFGAKAPLTVYRARKDGEPVAAIMTTVAPDGYSGNIKLLVAVYFDGTLAGVRVVNHRETPGLGDAIEVERSDWIRGFDGRSLGNPGISGWRVKKDGGEFDQFTGATITPRAVVKSVYQSLQYFNTHRELLFRPNIAAVAGTPASVDDDSDDSEHHND
ncbi:MAG: electron transport complex subunit RsxG [Gammaproteobacteria bacterium]|nr:electron transport complex subunit RsxG [Gammaproteobacteria bacterium]